VKNRSLESHFSSYHICLQSQTHTQKPQQEDQKKQPLAMSGFTTKTPSNFWFVDSGCTNHTTYDRNLFKELKKITNTKVINADGECIPVEDIGTIAIESHSGVKLILNNVNYIPKNCFSLLSIAQLLEEGYEVLFKQNKCLIKDQNNKIIQIQMNFRKFILDSMNIKYIPDKDEKKKVSESKEDHVDIGVSKKFPVKRKNEDVSEEPPSFITKLKNNITAIKSDVYTLEHKLLKLMEP